MITERLKAQLLQEVPKILQNHITDMRNKDEKFQHFFDHHQTNLEPVIKKVSAEIIETIFMNEVQYQAQLKVLSENVREMGRSFVLQFPELAPDDVLALNQNLYFHMMKMILQMLDGKVNTDMTKSTILERLHLVLSTSDHSFLQGFLQLKDKQVIDLHHQKVSLMGEMAAGMAHEIRNPLTSIKGFVSLMMEQLNEQNLNKEELRYYLQICKDQMDSLESIVSHFLTLVREKDMKSSPELFSFKSVLERINVLAQFYALEKNIMFSYNLPDQEIHLCGSPQVLDQICLNLIRNGMDAVSLREFGWVHIECILKEEEGVIDIVVVDNGPGIPSEIVDKIWSPFFTTKETGTGLGLFICRQLAEKMGGALQIHSYSGEGTEAILTLPVVTTEYLE